MMYPAQYSSADVGRRIGGYLIDWVVIFVVIVAVQVVVAFGFAFVIGALVGAASYTDEVADNVAGLAALLSYPIIPLYLVVAWGWFGRTIGQRIVGIHVIAKANPRLGGTGFGPAFARLIGYVVCWVIPFGIGFFLGLHDKIASTEAIVIQQPYSYSSGAHSPTRWQPPPAAFAATRPSIPADNLADQAHLRCPHCGIGLSFGARFCNGCGTRLV